MILKVIKTYESNKVALCVAIIEGEFADLTSAPAFLSIKKPVTKGQLITLPVDAIIVKQAAKNPEGEPLASEHGEPIVFSYWKLGA